MVRNSGGTAAAKSTLDDAVATELDATLKKIISKLNYLDKQIETVKKQNEWTRNQLQRLETVILTAEANLKTQSLTRWEGDEADLKLTWSRELSGDPYIRKVMEHCDLKGKRVLGIGPGYGRLFKALKQIVPDFASYIGIDLSTARIQRLTDQFAENGRVRFMCANADSFSLDEPIDVVISRLTFKFFYPSFKRRWGTLNCI